MTHQPGRLWIISALYFHVTLHAQGWIFLSCVLTPRGESFLSCVLALTPIPSWFCAWSCLINSRHGQPNNHFSTFRQNQYFPERHQQERNDWGDKGPCQCCSTLQWCMWVMSLMQTVWLHLAKYSLSLPFLLKVWTKRDMHGNKTALLFLRIQESLQWLDPNRELAPIRVPIKNTLNRHVVLGGEAESKSEGIRTAQSHNWAFPCSRRW